MGKHIPIVYRPHPIGVGTQAIYRFGNGYGASVVRTPYTYGGDKGLFELGVIKFNGDRWRLTCKTPITNDVEGYLKPDDVETLLDRIAALASKPKETE